MAVIRRLGRRQGRENPGGRRHVNRQRGFSLLEGILAIAVAGAASLVIIRFAASSSAQVKHQIAAQQLRAIRNAMEDYISSSHCDPLGKVPVLPSNATAAGTPYLQQLKNSGLLPDWFGSSNPFGETYTILTRRIIDASAVDECDQSVEAIVSTRGRQGSGACIARNSGVLSTDGYLEADARAMAAMIGADGGWIPYEDDDVNGDTIFDENDSIEGVPEGSFGGWRFPEKISDLYAGAAELPGGGCLIGVIYVRTN